MKFVELTITALNHSSSSEGNYVIILQEINGNRKIPFIIGPFEAQLIAIALENLTPSRPLTHDLLLNTCHHLEATLDHVKIIEIREDETFISALVIKDRNNHLVDIDSRTSDALALAVRQGCKILIVDTLMDKYSFDMEEKDFLSESRRTLEQSSIEELEEMLEISLLNEDYEKASMIRDIIKNKK